MLNFRHFLMTFPLAALAVTCGAATLHAEQQWVTYEGGEGPGKGKHIVFVSGDDEYRSEEACPQLAKILSQRHGFKCTVLFAIDPKTGAIKPDHQTNIPGTHFLNDADMMVVFLRFRNLPDEQMKPIIDFTNSGKPILGLRTSTHAFNIPGDKTYSKWSWRSGNPKGGWGQAVLGDTWISHHGSHKHEATRGVINPKHADHPILNSVKDVFGPTDVYGIKHLRDDDEILMHGAVLAGMKPGDPPVEGPKNNPMMPLVWTRLYKGEGGNVSRVINTTMGASIDLECEDLRRLLVNACFWGLKMDVPEKANVDIVGEFKPSFYGFGSFTKGVMPSAYNLR
jgi:hypothetical protein